MSGMGDRRNNVVTPRLQRIVSVATVERNAAASSAAMPRTSLPYFDVHQ
jgi:hypothetical protein